MFGNTSSPFAQKANPGTTGFSQQSNFGTSNAFGTPQQSNPTASSTFAQTPAFSSSFGTPATQSSFGTPTQSTFVTPNNPTFGVATSFASTPLSFGTNTQKTGFGATTQGSVSFGATTQASVSFGATSTQATPGSTQATPAFNFGSSVGQASFGSTTPALSSGVSTQPSLSFNPPQSTSSGFNLSKTPAPNFGIPSTSAQPSLSFGTSLTTKSVTSPATSSGFTFSSGNVSQAISTQNVSLGLSNLSYSSSSIGGKSMLTITGNTTTPLYGSKSSDLNASKTHGQIPTKFQAVHPLVTELVESFKNHIKAQKHLCLEVSRASLKPISKISNDAENIKKSVMKLECAVNKNKMLNSKLKEETIKALADVEIAQKAMDYPGGFPCDNSIVTEYFLQLSIKFQAQVVALRIELENTEKSIMCELNPAAFTPQELSTTMQRLYECFVALAGRFQFVHAQVSNLKVQHLELRKKKLEDYTDIFSKKNFSMKATNEAVSLSMGPSPFSGFRNYHSMNVITSSSPQQSDSLTFAPSAIAHSFFNNTLNKSSLQNTSGLLSSSPSTAPGSKRGKR